ncbi:Tex family protein [Faecalispora anaeroviscerum]|uniref:Tex family protein n=1 Tax=Faecalispora anaeroviscerum TaxID=2991836 RepID=UPI0024BB85B1|nr:Tex family protein [Faecalispora anaeroviscerum]
MDMIAELSKEFHLAQQHVGNIISLIDDGNTIPFIARYRKEMTGSCDDQVLRELSERLQYIRNLEKRKEEILESITAQEKLTDALSLAIQNTKTLAEAEDLYRPYRPKRRTRATIAQEQGLRPLADLLLAQNQRSGTPEALARPFVNTKKGVETWEDGVQGAKDILAEEFSDDAETRKRLRQIMRRDGLVVSRAVQENPVYEMYTEYSEPIGKIPSHRILAIDRGEKEECLKVKLELNDTPALAALCDRFVKPGSITSACVKEAVEDAWKRLIFPSLEREIRNELTQRAAKQAIAMFALNLKPLLLQPPVKDKVVMGFDPAYRTGCKIAVVDGTGKVLDTTVVYPTPPHKKTEEAKKELKRMILQYGVTVISIGNGTASKESEIFMAELIRELEVPVGYMVVSEAGASVYSASKLAASEFPEFDVSLRSAVSIARRLQDPLAELVKIDPKAIGIGQYQHDMPPAQLDSALEGVVESCVNSVGVDLNTASVSLLTHISGLNETVAKNVVSYRDENGPFGNRTQLKKVPRLGPKAYEQCAGFLRIPRGKNILDNTSVHPESYNAVTKLLELLGLKPSGLTMQGVGTLSQQIEKIGWEKTAAACGVGIPTLNDIIAELQKPGRDIRDELPPPLLRSDIMNLSDLKAGMELTGTVRNVIDFGVFVDIGVHQDGLVHISQMCDHFIKHPSDLVKVGDVVTVTVLSVDENKKRISLTMKKQEAQKEKS